MAVHTLAGHACPAKHAAADIVEEAQIPVRQGQAITLALIDVLQSIRDLVSPDGATPNANLLLHAQQAQQLLEIGDDLGERAAHLLTAATASLYGQEVVA